ncbi:anthrax toxin receptor-like [Acomys russatus]|uniref:anthrax toxin receptor-like n=1 Tax=Acomys russatus TaxID=60746 RepID=UPI0021E271A5|nr:anthrax toxin receptor-like [Acomys russatus]
MLSFCPQIPHSVLFLMMLPPSLLSTTDFLYQYAAWENYPGLGLGPRTFQHQEDQNPRHMWHRRDSNQKVCQATPDIYFVLDKSEHMMNAWPHVHKFVVDMLQRITNQDLRVSIITFSCKGNIILPITGDKEEILKGIERLKYSIPAGHLDIFRGIWKANTQMKKVNSGGVERPSMIISLLNGPLSKEAYNYSLGEANYARKHGASIYCVGTGYSEEKQIIGLAGKPENAFPYKKPENLKDLINPIASKVCPYLKSSETRIICVRVSNPVVLRGYGFDFAMRKEEAICRFYFSGIVMTFEDVKATNLTRTTATCPGPIVDKPGQVIYVLLSLDNGKNFLNNNVFVASKPCVSTRATTLPTTATTSRRLTTKTTLTTTTTTTESPTTILFTEQPKPSGNGFIFAPVLLALLLTILLIGCLWQLCSLPPPVKELPPPKPQPQPRQKRQPPPPVSPPAPTPPVAPSPIVIICCCTCRGLCVSRDMEGNVIVCNFNPLCCHQLPSMWPQCGDQEQCTNYGFLKALCAQDPCSPKVPGASSARPGRTKGRGPSRNLKVPPPRRGLESRGLYSQVQQRTLAGTPLVPSGPADAVGEPRFIFIDD